MREHLKLLSQRSLRSLESEFPLIIWLICSHLTDLTLECNPSANLKTDPVSSEKAFKPARDS